MTQAQATAYRLRWLLLVLAGLCLLPGVLWIIPVDIRWFGLESMGLAGTPVVWGAWLTQKMNLPGERTPFYAASGVFIGLLLLMQWLFLRPRRGWWVRVQAAPRPLWTSILAGAFMATLLSTGIAATLLELPNWWQDYAGIGDKDHVGSYVVWAGMLVIWAVWAWIFWLYGRETDRYTWLTRRLRGLLAGSILEVLVAAPIQAWAAHKRDCYCARGSYTGLVLGLAVLLWCFGPGLVFLFLREKARRGPLLERKDG